VRRMLAATLAALVLVACGDEDETETGALSRSEFARKANGLCANARADQQTILSAIEHNDPDPGEAATLVGELIAVDRKLIRDVDDLVPPPAEQDDVDQLLDRWRDRVDLEEQVRDAVAAADRARQSQLQAEVQAVDRQADRIAGSQLLLNECTRSEPGA
jgi:hypothetical protein